MNRDKKKKSYPSVRQMSDEQRVNIVRDILRL